MEQPHYTSVNFSIHFNLFFKIFSNLAAYNGRFDVVTYLTQHGANIELDTLTGATPIHTAAYHGHLEIVKYLREKGARADAEQSNKWTPLHLGKINILVC